MNSCTLSPWRNLLTGIDHATGSAQIAFDVPIARQQNVNVLRVDLQCPGLEFMTTPKSGKYQTENQTIFDFLREHGDYRGMVAINGCLAAAESSHTGAAASLFGLAKSRGKLVCDPTQAAPNG